MQVLVITADQDVHPGFVKPHLEAAGAEMIVIGPQNVLNGNGLTFDGEDGETWLGDQRLDEIRSVWWRKPPQIESGDLPGQAWWHPMAIQAIDIHARSLRTSFPRAFWVSDRFAIDRAQDKWLQIRLAKKLGFRVPATLQTSDPKKAQAFVEEQWRQHGACVVKPLAGRAITDPDGRHWIPWTAVLRPGDDCDYHYEGLRFTPMIFQQFIDGIDERVAVFGSELHAAEVIDPSRDMTPWRRDWREEGHIENIIVRPTLYPDPLAALCVKMLRCLDLQHGDFDFAQDAQGERWFFEVNPNGQFAWIEEHTKQPLGLAMANLLMYR